MLAGLIDSVRHLVSSTVTNDGGDAQNGAESDGELPMVKERFFVVLGHLEGIMHQMFHVPLDCMQKSARGGGWRGLQYSTLVVVQLILLSGDLKNAGHLRQVMISSVMAGAAPELQAILVDRCKSLPLPDRSTLFRYVFYCDVGLMKFWAARSRRRERALFVMVDASPQFKRNLLVSHFDSIAIDELQVATVVHHTFRESTMFKLRFKCRLRFAIQLSRVKAAISAMCYS